MEKGVASTDTPGGLQKLNVVSQAGVYELILKRSKPEAVELERWITKEVPGACPNVQGQRHPNAGLQVRQWFVASDVCRALGLKNTTQALHGVDVYEKGLTITETLGGQQKLNVISRSGVYELILRSRRPEAVEFQRWITKEVLPARALTFKGHIRTASTGTKRA